MLLCTVAFYSAYLVEQRWFCKVRYIVKFVLLITNNSWLYLPFQARKYINRH